MQEKNNWDKIIDAINHLIQCLQSWNEDKEKVNDILNQPEEEQIDLNTNMDNDTDNLFNAIGIPQQETKLNLDMVNITHQEPQTYEEKLSTNKEEYTNNDFSMNDIKSEDEAAKQQTTKIDIKQAHQATQSLLQKIKHAALNDLAQLKIKLQQLKDSFYQQTSNSTNQSDIDQINDLITELNKAIEEASYRLQEQGQELATAIHILHNQDETIKQTQEYKDLAAKTQDATKGNELNIAIAYANNIQPEDAKDNFIDKDIETISNNLHDPNREFADDLITVNLISNNIRKATTLTQLDYFEGKLNQLEQQIKQEHEITNSVNFVVNSRMKIMLSSFQAVITERRNQLENQ